MIRRGRKIQPVFVAVFSAVLIFYVLVFTHIVRLPHPIYTILTSPHRYFIWSSDCKPAVDYYVDEQAIYDDAMPEGQFERIQQPKYGQKRYCWSYKENRTIVEVLNKPTPSIIRVGTKRFKDPSLLALAYQLNLDGFTDKEPVSFYYVDNYTDFVWADGQYSPYKRAITVKSGADYQTQRQIFAHEYLHYVWHRDELSKDTQLVDELNAFYKQSTSLQKRMKSYEERMVVPTEFFSYGCTEWSSYLLTPHIVAKCEQYIDRSKLQVYY